MTRLPLPSCSPTVPCLAGLAAALLLLLTACAPTTGTAYLQPVAPQDLGQMYVRAVAIAIPQDAPEALRTDLRQQLARLAGTIPARGRPVDLAIKVRPAVLVDPRNPPPLSSVATLLDPQTGQVLGEVDLLAPTAPVTGVAGMVPDWLGGNAGSTPARATIDQLQAALLAPGRIGIAADAGVVPPSRTAESYAQSGVNPARAPMGSVTGAFPSSGGPSTLPLPPLPSATATPGMAPLGTQAPAFGSGTHDVYFGTFRDRSDGALFASWAASLAGPFPAGLGPRLFAADGSPQIPAFGPVHVGVTAVPLVEAQRICAVIASRNRYCDVVPRRGN